MNLSPTRLAGQWTRALTYEDHEPPSSSRLASGASERELWVEVRGHPDRPVRGWLELLPRNAIDQRLELDEQGRSWIGGLDSNIDTVRIGCAGLSPFERELPRTRAPRRRLELDMSRAPIVHGRVLTPQGFPLAEARIQVDGQPTLTDSSGRFELMARASGAPLLQVEADSYAPYRASLPHSEGGELMLPPLTLYPACRLSLQLEASTLDPGESVQLELRPGGALDRAHYPRGELRLAAGESLLLEDLPPGRLSVLVRRQSVAGDPVEVRLDPRFEAELSLPVPRLAPLPGA